MPADGEFQILKSWMQKKQLRSFHCINPINEKTKKKRAVTKESSSRLLDTSTRRKRKAKSARVDTSTHLNTPDRTG